MTYKVVFLFINFITLYTMKIIGLRLEPKRKVSSTNHLFRSPLFSPNTKQVSSLTISNFDLSFNLVQSTLLLVSSHTIIQFAIQNIEMTSYFKSLIVMPFIFSFTIFLGSFTRCLCSLTQVIPINIHNHPLRSKSITEFWSLRWNIWIRDWLHQVGRYFFPHQLIYRKFFIFFISGLFHEMLINLPYYLYTGKVLLGSMMVYFLIQFCAIYLDRYLKNNNFLKLRVLFMYSVILIPAPLFANEALRLFFGF